MDKFKQLTELFLEVNAKINLSAYNTFDEVYQKNVLDSMHLAKFMDLKGLKVLDVGTGGGFPLLPLAIEFETAEFTGLDSVHKKLKAIQVMAESLNLKNLSTLHSRCEDAAMHLDYREKFDVVLSRAFAKWPINLEMCLPFVKTDGVFIAYQGPSVVEALVEYKDIEQQFGAKLEKIEQVQTENGLRYFVFFRKTKTCPKKYPRGLKFLKNFYKLSRNGK